MNTHQGLRLPVIQLGIAILIVFTLGVLAIGIPVAWTLIRAVSGPLPVKTDPVKVVNALHSAINSNDTEALLAFFTRDATVDDSGSIIQGREEIQDWLLHSQRIAGVHLEMIRSETNTDHITWIDIASNGAEEQRDSLLRWKAVIQGGKIQSLTVAPVLMPDGK